MNVKTNIRSLFFEILRKKIPKTNSLLKILNKTTAKISYNYTRNMKFIKSDHRKQKL